MVRRLQIRPRVRRLGRSSKPTVTQEICILRTYLVCCMPDFSGGYCPFPIDLNIFLICPRFVTLLLLCIVYSGSLAAPDAILPTRTVFSWIFGEYHRIDELNAQICSPIHVRSLPDRRQQEEGSYARYSQTCCSCPHRIHHYGHYGHHASSSSSH